MGIFVGISAIAGMFDSIKEMFSEELHITPVNLVMVVIMVAGVLAIRYIIDMVLAFVSPIPVNM
ncbi:MAG: hypothetical protein IKN24_05410 [Lachnospiraceae bacterium]|nr:hypothetical protein [Lachnospiraceae bacterium]